MSDTPNTPESQAAPEAPTEDRFANFQKEMDRKLANQNAQMQSLLASLQSKQSPQVDNKKVSVFDNEEEYARQIEEKAAARIRSEIAAQNQSNSRQQAIISSIVQDYPEANDTSSDLYKRANEIYAGLDDSEKSSSLAMKVAVAQAAAEQGLKPKSKRSTPNNPSDSFSMSGSSKSTSDKPRKSDLDTGTEQFAQLMGLNTSDPKVRERLQSRKPIVRR